MSPHLRSKHSFTNPPKDWNFKSLIHVNRIKVVIHHLSPTKLNPVETEHNKRVTQPCHVSINQIPSIRHLHMKEVLNARLRSGREESIIKRSNVRELKCQISLNLQL